MKITIALFTRLLAPLFLMSAFPASTLGQTSALLPIRTAFEKEWLAVNQKGTADLQLLSTQYESALQRLQETKRQLGELDGLMAAQKERERFSTHKTVSLNDLVADFPELRQYQETFRQNTTRIRGENASARIRLLTQLESSLEKLQTSLTRENEIEDALLVRNYREEVKNRPEMAAARSDYESYQAMLASVTSSEAPPPASIPAPTPELARGEAGNSVFTIKKRFKEFYNALAEKDQEKAAAYIDPQQIREEGQAILKVRMDLYTGWIRAFAAFHGEPDTKKVELAPDGQSAVVYHEVEFKDRTEELDPIDWVKREGNWYIVLKERRPRKADVGPRPNRPPPPR